MLTASLLVLNLGKHNRKSYVKKKSVISYRPLCNSSKVQRNVFLYHGAWTRMAIII